MDNNEVAQFKHLSAILAKYEPIWNWEILNYYPRQNHYYPKEWVEEISNLCEQELAELDCNWAIDHLKNKIPNFYHFLMQANELTVTKKLEESNFSLDRFKALYLKVKKQHEIERVIPVLEKKKKSLDYKTLVDIGGGQGHLCRVFSEHLEAPSVCLEMNEEFIGQGKDKNQKLDKVFEKSDVSYIQFTLDKNSATSKSVLDEIEKPFISGLHTCGSLALDHLRTIKKENVTGGINIPCCYFKCDPEKDTSLSSLGKALPFSIRKHGLTLATRSHSKSEEKTYATKKRVKHYRYALHLFMVKKLGITEFQKTGSIKMSLYKGSFAQYGNFILNSWNMPEQDESVLEQFYRSDEIQNELKLLFVLNTIRWKFGRMVELLVLLDRKFWLEEQGFKVELLEIFDEKISPRNMAFVVSKKRP